MKTLVGFALIFSVVVTSSSVFAGTENDPLQLQPGETNAAVDKQLDNRAESASPWSTGQLIKHPEMQKHNTVTPAVSSQSSDKESRVASTPWSSGQMIKHPEMQKPNLVNAVANNQPQQSFHNPHDATGPWSTGPWSSGQLLKHPEMQRHDSAGTGEKPLN
jgi:hypothetical protein